MPKPKIAELEAGLKIDTHALEHVCRDHPELFYAVGKQLALLISQRDESKQKLKEVEADADSNLRHAAEVAGERLTEKAIESQKLLDPTVLAAKDAFFELEKQCGEMLALKEAYQARSYAIRDLVQLHLANYYGSDMERSTGNMRAAHAAQNKQKVAEMYRRK